MHITADCWPFFSSCRHALSSVILLWLLWHLVLSVSLSSSSNSLHSYMCMAETQILTSHMYMYIHSVHLNENCSFANMLLINLAQQSPARMCNEIVDRKKVLLPVSTCMYYWIMLTAATPIVDTSLCTKLVHSTLPRCSRVSEPWLESSCALLWLLWFPLSCTGS